MRRSTKRGCIFEILEEVVSSKPFVFEYCNRSNEQEPSSNCHKQVLTEASSEPESGGQHSWKRVPQENVRIAHCTYKTVVSISGILQENYIYSFRCLFTNTLGIVCVADHAGYKAPGNLASIRDPNTFCVYRASESIFLSVFFLFFADPLPRSTNVYDCFR